jgi:peptidyl-prolyl cis-trans isomerase B (cyclophilin B)
MRTIIIVILFVTTQFSFSVQSQTKIEIVTSLGIMRGILYDLTPIHKENFIDLVRQNHYDGMLFHRVISDFMIQTGDPDSKKASPGQPLGHGDVGYTLPPEFDPMLYHKKGAIAAARQPDNINPQKESSGSQFYIVQGRVFTPEQLEVFVDKDVHIPFTPQQIEDYTTIGGTPHLDYSYTVFGEITDGLNVIDTIASVQTDPKNRPLKDIKILEINILN